MKNTIKIILFFIAIFASLWMKPNISHATTIVTDEESLLRAIESDEYVTLQNNITVTKPIVVAKEITIDGNGYTITGSSDWISTSGNQSMFTAQSSTAKLTLKNINLQNGPKYGVQSYDGALVILNDVFIADFRYGGVLLNGGRVEVQKLHLGNNGTANNNGIEIDKGSAVKNNPTLVMNGVLTADSTENLVRVAENGYLTEFTITNTPNSTNKVILTGEKIALVNSKNEIISETIVPEKATGNTDTRSVIITLIVQEEIRKIAVEEGEKITAEFFKSRIELSANEIIDGFFLDKEFQNEFDFNNIIDSDMIIYTKVSLIEEIQPPEEDNSIEEEVEIEKNEEKDDTPKTGVTTYFEITALALVLSVGIIIWIKNKM